MEVTEGDAEAVAKRLQEIFGIVSVSPVAVADLSLEAIQDVAVKEFAKVARPGLRFKVNTKRANKQFPLPSMEVSAKVGAHLLKNFSGLKVDVHEPEAVLDVEIREENAFIYTERLEGPGGLPVGVAGKGLLLLSGGIDSPVAGFLTMKRGVTLEALHFHSPPFTSERAKEK